MSHESVTWLFWDELRSQHWAEQIHSLLAYKWTAASLSLSNAQHILHRIYLPDLTGLQQGRAT